MEVISSVFSLGVSIQGYNEGVLAELLREHHPDTVYLTEITPDDFKPKNEQYQMYDSINKIVATKFQPVGIDTSPYDKFKQDYIKEHLSTPELSIKRNMLDLIEDTISNYLSQYWKGPETVNSEVTDSLFRAKHKLFASVFFELEAEYWDKRNEDILKRIKEENPADDSVIITSVEGRYWFKDHLTDIFQSPF